MKKSINKIIGKYMLYRVKGKHQYFDTPFQVQRDLLLDLIKNNTHTLVGEKYDFKSIQDIDSFKKSIPIQTYESLYPYILMMLHGEKDVLSKGVTKMFSKSAGTSIGKSKFIPISEINMHTNHIRGTWDTMSFIYQQLPNAQQFQKKTLLMGGSIDPFPDHPDSIVGDISAMMIHRMPWLARPYFTPDFKTALIKDWEEKIQKFIQILHTEKDLVMLGGVPSWTKVLFEELFKFTGKDKIKDIWPHLQAYTHGGVNFEPYRPYFENVFEGVNPLLVEIYNASEGFFAIQNSKEDGMVLLLNNGVFYEFIPKSEWNKENPETLDLNQVELFKEYALVISTNGGLWRYSMGDTIKFVSKNPYKIKITGRVSQQINTCGEEVSVENTDQAIGKLCREFDLTLNNYSVGPIFSDDKTPIGHHWLLEFDKNLSYPTEKIEIELDKILQSLNSDYEAKRSSDLVLKNLKITILEKGTFHRWLRDQNKFGGQNKVIRLSNNRKTIQQILDFAKVVKSNFQ